MKWASRLKYTQSRRTSGLVGSFTASEKKKKSSSLVADVTTASITDSFRYTGSHKYKRLDRACRAMMANVINNLS